MIDGNSGKCGVLWVSRRFLAEIFILNGVKIRSKKDLFFVGLSQFLEQKEHPRSTSIPQYTLKWIEFEGWLKKVGYQSIVMLLKFSYE